MEGKNEQNPSQSPLGKGEVLPLRQAQGEREHSVPLLEKGIKGDFVVGFGKFGFWICLEFDA
jgi:hypothetical protein